MGARKKGAAGQEKRQGQYKSGPKQKMFQTEMSEEDFDSSDSDVNMEEMAVSKKTPNKGGQTPKQNQSGKKDVRVSFQLQGKGSPQQKGTPKGKVATPASAKGSANKVNAKGQSPLTEFSSRNPFGAKVEKMNPPIKGKVFSPKVKKGMEQASDDDEEDEDSEDDDFDDEDMDDLIDEEDDDDIDEDDEEDEDDDKEDDDDDEDDEDIRRTLLAIQGQKVSKSNGIDKTKDTPKAKTPKKMTFETPKPAQSPNSKANKQVETPKSVAKANKQGETPKSTLKSNKASASPKPVNQASPSRGFAVLSPVTRVPDAQERRERDLKTLFVRGIPKEITAEDLKAMFPDILDVRVPAKAVNHKFNNYYAFVEFPNEKKAEENYTLLQNKKLSGKAVFVDFTGEKSKNRPAAPISTKERDNTPFNKKELVNTPLNKQELVVTGYPNDTTIVNIAPLFPKAVSIHLTFRKTFVMFNNEQDASEALTAGSKSVIDGRPVTVMFARERKQSFAMEKPHPKRKRSAKPNQPPAKRQHIALMPDSDDSSAE